MNVKALQPPDAEEDDDESVPVTVLVFRQMGLEDNTLTCGAATATAAAATAAARAARAASGQRAEARGAFQESVYLF